MQRSIREGCLSQKVEDDLWAWFVVKGRGQYEGPKADGKGSVLSAEVGVRAFSKTVLIFHGNPGEGLNKKLTKFLCIVKGDVVLQRTEIANAQSESPLGLTDVVVQTIH